MWPPLCFLFGAGLGKPPLYKEAFSYRSSLDLGLGETFLGHTEVAAEMCLNAVMKSSVGHTELRDQRGFVFCWDFVSWNALIWVNPHRHRGVDHLGAPSAVGLCILLLLVAVKCTWENERDFQRLNCKTLSGLIHQQKCNKFYRLALKEKRSVAGNSLKCKSRKGVNLCISECSKYLCSVTGVTENMMCRVQRYTGW